jgi:hypothetical protein
MASGLLLLSTRPIPIRLFSSRRSISLRERTGPRLGIIEPCLRCCIIAGKAGVNGRSSTMSHGERNSKRKGRTKAVTVLEVAGALSLAGGASGAAVGPPGDALTVNTAVTLHEEEISDVSLSTFYVFDHENAGARRPGLQLARRTGSRPRQGSGGCAVDDCAGGGPTC